MSDEGSLPNNKYSLVKGAARRARQLQSGAPPLGVSNSMKACKVAQDEIRVGKVTYSVVDKKPAAPPPAPEPDHEME
ncbi:MAG TPA: DNA-directed RNA polymerase subunit omega [Acidobacteriaceae bacterium]|jgi:DNA-directed RNA polymerase subunit omega|nr:DNA-directed RNA polymerase subunit omega [Acidobacteriaceae bacterium]